MGSASEKMRAIKAGLYTRLVSINDRAFSLVTIFIISFILAYLEPTYHLISHLSDFWWALAALVALVVSTILSTIVSKMSTFFRKFSAFLCLFLWTLVAMLGEALHNNNSGITIAIYYTILFWSNVNLLGVFLNVDGKR